MHRSGLETKERMTLFAKIFNKIKKHHPFLQSSSQYKSSSEMSLKAGDTVVLHNLLQNNKKLCFIFHGPPGEHIIRNLCNEFCM